VWHIIILICCRERTAANEGFECPREGLPECYIQANTIAATIPEIICRDKIWRAKMFEYIAGVLVTTHISPDCPGAFFPNHLVSFSFIYFSLSFGRLAFVLSVCCNSM
jgi:hypothetical protein